MSDCNHTIEMPALGVEKDHEFVYDAVMVVVHRCTNHDTRRQRHYCRCGFWWVPHDHDPFATGTSDH